MESHMLLLWVCKVDIVFTVGTKENFQLWYYLFFPKLEDFIFSFVMLVYFSEGDPWRSRKSCDQRSQV